MYMQQTQGEKSVSHPPKKKKMSLAYNPNSGDSSEASWQYGMCEPSLPTLMQRV